jgi:hypothetical protein
MTPSVLGSSSAQVGKPRWQQQQQAAVSNDVQYVQGWEQSPTLGQHCLIVWVCQRQLLLSWCAEAIMQAPLLVQAYTRQHTTDRQCGASVRPTPVCIMINTTAAGV